MRIATCGRGTLGIMRALWPLVVLCCVMSCAVTSREIEMGEGAPVGDVGAVEGSADGARVETEVAVSPVPVDSKWVQLRGTTVEALGSTHRLVFDLSRTPDSVTHFQLPKPPRVVLDVHGPHQAARLVDRYQADDPLVERVRVGHYDGRMRLVVDLKEKLPKVYHVRREGGALVVYLGELGGEHGAVDPGADTEKPAADSLTGDSVSTDETVSISDSALTANLAPAAKATEPGDAAGEVSQAEGLPEIPKPPVPEVSPSGEVAAAKGAVPEETPADSTEVVPVESEPTQSRVVEADLQKSAPASKKPEPDVSELAAAEKRETARLAKLSRVPKTREPTLKNYTGKRISLDFKDADVQNILRVIADVSQLNIVATDDVTGRVTLHLVDVPWDQALDVVLEANRLKMIREGNVIRISTVERVREEQEALRAQQNAEQELEPLGVRYVRVNYARADEALLEKVEKVLTERGKADFDERTNTVIVRDIGKGIDDAIELISNLDIQSPQVLIEANLVEATTDFAQALGVQWGYRYLAGPMTGNPTGSNFPGTVDLSGSGLGTGSPAPPAGAGAPQPLVPLISDFPVPSNFGPGFGPGGGSALDLALGSLSGSDTLSARLTALEEEGKGKIISRPRVITLNNVPAKIESLTILRVKLPDTGTVLNTGAGGVAGTASAATEKIETGIILTVTPQVSSDGYVLLNIKAKSSQADFTRTVDEIPVEVSREATSNVLIRNSETVVLGGIFRNEVTDTETGVPYLRRVPALGWLFKRMGKRDRKEELLVFITPQVVAGYGAELPSAAQLWDNRTGG